MISTLPFECGRSATPPLLAELPACESCGGPARVRILEGYVDGAPRYRSACLNCADRTPTEAPSAGSSRGVRAAALVAIAGGAALAAFGVVADHVGVRGVRGFGGYQVFAVLVGATCLLVGALLRVDALAAAGAVLFGLAVAADALGIGGAPGFGWKQALALCGGVGLVGAGTLFARRVRPRAAVRVE